MLGTAEIYVLGTGGGYGESIVANLGNNEWIIIDSCIHPNNNKCLPLEFLHKKDVDLDDVKMIICTHWHSDHIKGLSLLIEKCGQAKFVFSHATDYRKFISFINYDYKFKGTTSDNSSTKEFNRCLEIIIDKKQAVKKAQYDKLLYATSYKSVDIKVWSLSPSEKAMKNYDLEISEYFQNFSESNIKLPKLTPNDKSVVILLELGKHIAILGADLEVKLKDPDLGWLDIVHNSVVVKSTGKAKYFKIPHHGSKNGYHDDIWNILLDAMPIGCLTPSNRHSLPRKLMIDKYSSLTSELYSSSKPKEHTKPKKRSTRAKKTISNFNETLREIVFNQGIISTYVNITDPGSEWVSTCDDSAIKINA